MSQDKISLFEKFDWLVTNSLLAIAAAFIRLCFGVRGTWKEAIVTFFGGIVFGVTVGFLIRDVAWMHSYNNFFVGVAALAGKELFAVIVRAAPATFEGVWTAIGNAAKNKINPKQNDERHDDTPDTP